MEGCGSNEFGWRGWSGCEDLVGTFDLKKFIFKFSIF